MFAQILSEYGVTILGTILTAVMTYIGLFIKGIYKKRFETREKQAVAEACVQFAEQVYKELNGPEKLDKALEAAEEMLAAKGITITQLELRVLIESAVASFNDAFNRERRITENACESD